MYWRDTLLSYCHDADLIVVEDFAFSQPQRAHELGGVAYVVRIALVEAGFNLLKIPVGTNKKFTTGVGNANKHQMVLNVFKRWGFETKHDDVADAYSLARCGQAFLNPKTQRDAAVVKTGVRLKW